MEIQKYSSIPERYDYLFKIVLVGDSGVGKTNLLSQLTKQNFCTTTPPTIGVEFTTVNFKVGEDIIKAQIWDTAGQERFRAITSAYYRGTYGALIVYDVTRKQSLFQSVNHWFIQLRQHARNNPTIVLVGNKVDLDESREITTEAGKRIAEENNVLFIETSALSGENVKKAFLELVNSIYEKNKRIGSVGVKKELGFDKKNIEKVFKKTPKKSGCC